MLTFGLIVPFVACPARRLPPTMLSPYVVIAFIPSMLQCVPGVTTNVTVAVIMPICTGTAMIRSMGMGVPFAACNVNSLVGTSAKGTPADRRSW